MSRVYIIAEAGVNHNGSLKFAKELVDVARKADADAVKFQTFKTKNLVSQGAPKAEYQLQTTDPSESQFEMIKKLELSENDHEELVAHCKLRGIEFLSTPFDLDSADLLIDRFSLPRIKLPSGEIDNAPLLLRVARSGKPIILSTGMSTLGDVENALGILAFGYTQPYAAPSTTAFRQSFASRAGQETLRKLVTLLHCTTEYPAPFPDINLRAMDTLASAFGLAVGYSDHTVGIAIAAAAVARGAAVIEKHFTLDKNLPGPDHKASLEPAEFAAMVTAIRQVETSLGSSIKAPSEAENANRLVVRKSLVAARPIRKGETFSSENLTCKRPGSGISPSQLWDIIGKPARRDFNSDELIEL